MKTLKQVRSALELGQATSAALVSEALERAADKSGEGSKAFLKLYHDAALQTAHAHDKARAQGLPQSPLAGLPVSVKDLFDVAGEITLAGSRVRADAPPAAQDSVVAKRLREAGAAIVGRTNMTEFAYSGLGLNPHYGTPLNPFDRATGRIPGGSSSGAAVSVSDGMALVAVASDTGGSARIPAAFCGLTGFKPTASRIPTEGAFPLSPSLDSVGVIGPSVACCAQLDAVLAGEAWNGPEALQRGGIRIGVVIDCVTGDLDPEVARAYQAALGRLSASGVQIEEVRYPELFELPAYNHKGGFAAYESYRLHESLIEQRGEEYDPRVATRIRRGKVMEVREHECLRQQRKEFIRASVARFTGVDALVSPTVPMIAPRIADCGLDADFSRLNLLALRNPSLVNFLDGCAISIPCHRPGDAPVGLMLFQMARRDKELLALAQAVEAIVRVDDQERQHG
jgi:aspartyl-tRNA(Asn)/glutamyl-tRNA(Gln) amidotransferase subunit A